MHAKYHLTIVFALAVLLLSIVSLDARRGGGGGRSSSGGSRSGGGGRYSSSKSSSSSSSYSKPSYSSPSYSSSSYNKPSYTSPSSMGFVSPKLPTSSVGFVTPKPPTSSMGFVAPKTSTSSMGFVTPKPPTSSMGFVPPAKIAAPQPPYNPAFNPNPALNKPYPVQPLATVNNNYLPNRNPIMQQFHPPIYQQPYVTNVIHQNRYNTPFVPVIIPSFSGTHRFHSSNYYGRHYGWDSSEERYGGGYNRESNTVHHHYHSPTENRIIKTENALRTSSEGVKYHATLYQHSRFEGNKLDIYLGIGECMDFPKNFNDDVSSINTHNNCVMLCENKKCTGECKQFGNGSDDSGVWVGDLLNDKGSSIILCNQDFNTTGAQTNSSATVTTNSSAVTVTTGSVIFNPVSAPENLIRPPTTAELQNQLIGPTNAAVLSVSDQAVNRESKFTQLSNDSWKLTSVNSAGPGNMKHEITLGEHGFVRGKELQVLIEQDECMDLPHLFHKQVSAINTHGNCAIMCSEAKCFGECRKFNGNFETFVGHYFNDMASSIALCPKNTSDSITILSKPELAHAYSETVFTAGTPGNKVRVTLYEHGYRKGHKIHVDIGENDKCINIPESFNDQTSSLDTHTNCIMLCENVNCEGKCVSYGPNAKDAFWVEDFNDKASSIKLCEPRPAP